VLLAGDVQFRGAVAGALGNGYAIVEVDSVNSAADSLLAARPHLAFVDMRNGSQVGVAVCRRIKGAAATRLLPVVACADGGEEAERLVGPDEETQEALRQGGVLHDIGKIGIPNEIINKAGLLTAKERIVMNKHPIIGERICEPLKSLRQLLPIIRWHHEKLDGTGYPDGLKGSQFPVPA